MLLPILLLVPIAAGDTTKQFMIDHLKTGGASSRNSVQPSFKPSTETTAQSRIFFPPYKFPFWGLPYGMYSQGGLFNPGLFPFVPGGPGYPPFDGIFGSPFGPGEFPGGGPTPFRGKGNGTSDDFMAERKKAYRKKKYYKKRCKKSCSSNQNPATVETTTKSYYPPPQYQPYGSPTGGYSIPRYNQPLPPPNPYPYPYPSRPQPSAYPHHPPITVQNFYVLPSYGYQPQQQPYDQPYMPQYQYYEPPQLPQGSYSPPQQPPQSNITDTTGTTDTQYSQDSTTSTPYTNKTKNISYSVTSAPQPEYRSRAPSSFIEYTAPHQQPYRTTTAPPPYHSNAPQQQPYRTATAPYNSNAAPQPPYTNAAPHSYSSASMTPPQPPYWNTTPPTPPYSTPAELPYLVRIQQPYNSAVAQPYAATTEQPTPATTPYQSYTIATPQPLLSNNNNNNIPSSTVLQHYYSRPPPLYVPSMPMSYELHQRPESPIFQNYYSNRPTKPWSSQPVPKPQPQPQSIYINFHSLPDPSTTPREPIQPKWTTTPQQRDVSSTTTSTPITAFDYYKPLSMDNSQFPAQDTAIPLSAYSPQYTEISVKHSLSPHGNFQSSATVTEVASSNFNSTTEPKPTTPRIYAVQQLYDSLSDRSVKASSTINETSLPAHSTAISYSTYAATTTPSTTTTTNYFATDATPTYPSTTVTTPGTRTKQKPTEASIYNMDSLSLYSNQQLSAILNEYDEEDESQPTAPTTTTFEKRTVMGKKRSISSNASSATRKSSSTTPAKEMSPRRINT